MKVGAVIAQDGNTVVPLVSGPVVRVFDTDTQTTSDLENPALTATKGKRILVVKLMLEHGVEVVLAPPSTFCEHSYKVAQHEGIRFVNLDAELPWGEAVKHAEETTAQSADIPEGRLSMHHHHHQ